MSYFKFAVYGLWTSLIYLALIIIGELTFPGSLYDTAFSDLGIISVFCAIISTIIYLLRSIQVG